MFVLLLGHHVVAFNLSFVSLVHRHQEIKDISRSTKFVPTILEGLIRDFGVMDGSGKSRNITKSYRWNTDNCTQRASLMFLLRKSCAIMIQSNH